MRMYPSVFGKEFKIVKIHLYSYLAKDIVELFNTNDKFNIPSSTNIAAAELLKNGRRRRG